MAILRERKVWKRPRLPSPTSPSDQLTPEQEKNVRAALAFLRVRVGSWAKLAKVMGLKEATLEQAANRRTRRPTAGYAVRAAQIARVQVYEILSGRWPRLGACPMCGR